MSACSVVFVHSGKLLLSAFVPPNASAFLKNKVIFALDSEGLSGLSKNLFEIDAYSAFTDDREAINIFYNELTSVLDMAAYFKLDEKTGL